MIIIDNTAVISALPDVKDGLKCHGKRRLVVWLFDKLKRENALTFEEYECLTSVKAIAFSI